MKDDEREAMLTEYRKGVSTAKLSKKYFVHYQTIIRYALAAGLKTPVERNKDLREARQRKIQDLQAQGYKTGAIGRAVGLGPTQVQELRTRDTGPYATERNNRVKADRAAGLTYNAIAVKNDISPHTVKRIIEGYKK